MNWKENEDEKENKIKWSPSFMILTLLEHILILILPLA